MKNNIFDVLQRIGKSFMLPIAVLPIAGLLLGIGSSFTNQTTISAYGLNKVLGSGTLIHALLVIMTMVGKAIFDNLPLIFAIGVAMGMAQKEKAVAALSSVIAYFVMNTAISGMLLLNNKITESGEISKNILDGTITSVCGILSLQTGVFGGIVVGLGVAILHNRFYKKVLPNALSFFGGTRFVPIVVTFVYMFVGIAFYFIWPHIQNGIYTLGGLVSKSGYIGTLIFGLIKRALIPLGLHHVFYLPFWHTSLGGEMAIAGRVVQGAQNIFFAQLADSTNIKHFSADATRFFSGEFIFMIFGLPGAALAMYRCAKKENKKAVGGLLLSASLTSMLTGITEPIEFSFLFVAPVLFAVQVILAGTAYMIAHVLNIAVGLTFSAGILDLFLFGILQGNQKTSWILLIPVGIIYFFLYYFIFRFLIVKFDFKTPGREDDTEEIKLYTRQDINNRKNSQMSENSVRDDLISEKIVKGLGGKKNIIEVDCCATRLRCTVMKEKRINDSLIKSTGASGIIHKGNSIQIVYGPQVTVIKSNLEDYLEHMSNNSSEVKKLQEMSLKTKEKEQEKKISESESKNIIKTIVISSPMQGLIDDLSKAPDEAFASKTIGDGVVITPVDSLVRAPENGEVTFVFETNHAIGFLTDTGINILIHVGIDTVKLNGKGFESYIKSGQKVKKGEPMLKLDLDYLKKNALSIVSPVLCTELEDNQKVRPLKYGKIEYGEELFAVDIYESKTN